MRCLPALVAQALERRMGDLAELGARRNLLTDLVHPDAEPVAVVVRLLDEPVGGERRGGSVDGALADAQAPGQLGHAEHRLAVAERRSPAIASRTVVYPVAPVDDASPVTRRRPPARPSTGGRSSAPAIRGPGRATSLVGVEYARRTRRRGRRLLVDVDVDRVEAVVVGLEHVAVGLLEALDRPGVGGRDLALDREHAADVTSYHGRWWARLSGSSWTPWRRRWGSCSRISLSGAPSARADSYSQCKWLCRTSTPSRTPPRRGCR